MTHRDQSAVKSAQSGSPLADMTRLIEVRLFKGFARLPNRRLGPTRQRSATHCAAMASAASATQRLGYYQRPRLLELRGEGAVGLPHASALSPPAFCPSPPRLCAVLRAALLAAQILQR